MKRNFIADPMVSCKGGNGGMRNAFFHIKVAEKGMFWDAYIKLISGAHGALEQHIWCLDSTYGVWTAHMVSGQHICCLDNTYAVWTAHVLSEQHMCCPDTICAV